MWLQLLRWKNAVPSSKTALFEDGWPKIQGLSSKTALFEDGWPKIQGLSSKTALYEDGLRSGKLMELQKPHCA